MKKVNHRIAAELVGVHCLNAGVMHNSPSRSQMLGSHLTSKIAIINPEPNRTQAGGEHEFGKYTDSVRMPANGRILSVVPLYPHAAGEGAIEFNPETLVIYEDTDTHHIDCFNIPYYVSYHQYFGYRNVLVKENIDKIIPGRAIKKGTLFAHSPGLGPFNNYMYGRNLNVALMAWPATAEDGIIICRDVLEKFKFNIYETRTVNLGSQHYPRLIYPGDRPFPEVGQLIRDDGLLMALRTYDSDYAPVEMGIFDIKNIDYSFDRLIYARESQSNIMPDGSIISKGGRVVGIEVVKNNSTQRMLPPKLAEPFEKYARAGQRYHRTILKVMRDLQTEQRKKQRDSRLNIRPGLLHQMCVRALALTNYQQGEVRGPLDLNVNQTPVDEYQITFTIEFEVTPNIGGKLTGTSGDKGTICLILDREEMPVDKDGVSADIVMSQDSSIARSNLSRLFQQDLNAAARSTTARIRKMADYHQGLDPHEHAKLIPQSKFKDIFDYAVGYFECISPLQHRTWCSYNESDQREAIGDILKEGIYNLIPIDSEKDRVQSIEELIEKYPYVYDTVRFKNPETGLYEESKDRVMIGSMYIMLLDKIADSWSAVASGKLQHFGVLAPRTKGDKASLPFRETPVTTIGATEGRIFAGYCGRRAIAEMMDRSNNPMTQRMMVHSILDAKIPTNIENTVDREVIPYGSTRPIQLVSHILAASGRQLTYISEKDTPSF